MSEVIYDPTPEQFGVFCKYVDDPDAVSYTHLTLPTT